MHKKDFRGIFTTALFGIGNNSVLINRGMDKQALGYFQNGMLLSTKQENLLISTSTEMGLRNMMLSQRSQTKTE